jgi:anti-sigma B factor antagonist
MATDGASQPQTDRRPGPELVSHAAGLISVVVQQLDQGVWTVLVAGEVDMLTGPLLQEQLNNVIVTRPACLIIDLSQVTFMGSTGLSVLITTRHAANQQDTTLQLRGTERRAVAHPLKITGLDHLFESAPP